MKAKKAHTKVTDFPTWSMAWSIFAAVLMEQDPSLAGPLLAYQFVIAGAAGTYRLQAWLAYDTAFRRMLASADQPDWSRIDPDLWQTRMAAGGTNPFCPTCNRRHAKPGCVTVVNQPFQPLPGAAQQMIQQPLYAPAFLVRSDEYASTLTDKDATTLLASLPTSVPCAGGSTLSCSAPAGRSHLHPTSELAPDCSALAHAPPSNQTLTLTYPTAHTPYMLLTT